MTPCRHIVVMGVAGSGKTTVAKAIGEALGLRVIEGDDYHPPGNVTKMAAGIPLTDADRLPWLEGLAALIWACHQNGDGTVLACSALRRPYRDILRSPVPEETFVVHLGADAETLSERMGQRTGHFMPATLLESQLATLEPLEADEAGVVIDATTDRETVIADVLAAVRRVAS